MAFGSPGASAPSTSSRSASQQCPGHPKQNYDLSAPLGVNGRNSDNTLIRKYLNWAPSIPLRTGLENTYAWIYDEFVARDRRAQRVTAY